MLWYHDKPPAVGLFAFSLYQLPMAAQWLSCAGRFPHIALQFCMACAPAAGGEHCKAPGDDSEIL